MSEAVTCNRCGKPIVFAGQDEQGKWIRNNPDGTPHMDARPQGGGARPGRSPAELHDIRREAVLNSAVAWASAQRAAGTELKTNDVVQIAQIFLKFVETDRPAQ